MMRKVSPEEIHRIRMCNARIRNENHLLRCTLHNISTNPYSECSRALTSVIHHCTKKKCEAKSGEPECCCSSCSPSSCCRNVSPCQNQQTSKSNSPPLCNRFNSSPTYARCKAGLCSKPFCSYCQTSGYSYPYSKLYNRTNSSTAAQPHTKPCNNSSTAAQPHKKPCKLHLSSPQKTWCRPACSDKTACKSSGNRSVPNQKRPLAQHQHPRLAYTGKRQGSLTSTATQPLPQTCCCCCCCRRKDTCKSSAAAGRNKCSHHSSAAQASVTSNSVELDLSPRNAKAHLAPGADRPAEGSSKDRSRPGCCAKCQQTCGSVSGANACPGTPHCVCHNQTNDRRDPAMLSPLALDDNESAAASRPCSKILGELAFQLERRMLDYVFGMEGSNRRRFYGYTVNNICQMMNKESKNMCGGDDPLRKSELAFRLKKLLVGLKKVGYNIKVHGDFAQQIVNTYGLLPCAPDSATIHDFGLHNANCIAGLINHLACDPAERDNLLILLNSLKYLSKCDSRPLFVW